MAVVNKYVYVVEKLIRIQKFCTKVKIKRIVEFCRYGAFSG